MSALAPRKYDYNTPETDFSQIEKCRVPKFPSRQMRALFDRGFHLIPCGGDDGKKPLRQKWNNAQYNRMPLDVCQKRMRSNASFCYGVRLDGLTVIDCDTWDMETQDYVSRNFPSTPFRVTTARGVHLYYASGDPLPPPVRSTGMQIDFKGGHNHFVVGPGSTRPDGVVYKPSIENLALFPDLPVFKSKTRKLYTVATKPEIVRRDGKIETGRRNNAITKKAAEFAQWTESQSELEDLLSEFAKTNFQSLDDFPDSEFQKIAKWAWNKRKQNRLYTGKQSEFRINRSAIPRLLKIGSGCGNATILYVRLLESHGHKPDQPFPVAVDAMAKAGLLPYSKSTAQVAKRGLISAGLIRLFRKGHFKQADLYKLANPATL